MPPEPAELAAIVTSPTLRGMSFRLPFSGDASATPETNIAAVKMGADGPTVRCLVERDGQWLTFTVLPDEDDE